MHCASIKLGLSESIGSTEQKLNDFTMQQAELQGIEIHWLENEGFLLFCSQTLAAVSKGKQSRIRSNQEGSTVLET